MKSQSITNTIDEIATPKKTPKKTPKDIILELIAAEKDIADSFGRAV